MASDFVCTKAGGTIGMHRDWIVPEAFGDAPESRYRGPRFGTPDWRVRNGGGDGGGESSRETIGRRVRVE